MSYSSAALTSAMNKSLYFENLINNTNQTAFYIGSFEYQGYYKVTLLSETTTIVIEISQGRVISVQSISSSHNRPTSTEDITEGLTPYCVGTIFDSMLKLNDNNTFKLLVEDILSAPNNKDKSISVNVEYSGGEFVLDPVACGSFKTDETTIGLYKNIFYFNTTEYDIGIVTSSVSATSIDVGTLTAESASIQTLRLGDWILTSNGDTGAVKLSLNPTSSKS